MKQLKYLCIAFLLSFVIYGCKKDHSNSTLNALPVFKIDTVGQQKSVTTGLGQTEVNFTPKIVFDGDTSKLTYLWRVYVGNAATADTLSTKKVLKAPVTRGPGTYTLELQVTNAAGLKVIMPYTLIVSAAVPYGWLLAYETPEGGNTDVGYVRTNEIVKTQLTDIVKYALYSSRNGAPLKGLPVGFGNANNPVNIWSEKDAATVNQNDFGKELDIESIFVGPVPTPTKIEAVMMNGTALRFVVNNGKVFWSNNTSISIPGEVGFTDPLGYTPSPYWVSVDGVVVFRGFFDQKNGRFIKINGTNEVGDAIPFVRPAAFNSASRFSLFDIQKTLLSHVQASPLSSTRLAFFRDYDGSRTWMYGINFVNENKPDDALFELSATAGLGTAMNQAKFFDIGSIQNMAVIATPTTIYGFSFSNTSIQNVSSGFTAPAGEEITAMKIFKNAGNGYSGAESKNNAILMVATWNATAKNGKLYMLGLNPSTGAVTSQTPLKVIGGFGKIKDMILKTAPTS